MEENRVDVRLMGVYTERRARMAECEIDATLIQACQNGDRAAFHTLFQAYKDKVYSIAYHYCGNPDLASDITQQAFLKILVGIKTFRLESELTTWIYRIVANTCTDEHRARRRFVPLGDGLDMRNLTAKGSVESGYHRRQLASAVSEAIATLKPKLRMPILLKYVEDLSYEEIATVLGCSKGTVASRLNRGHKVLASKLAYLKGSLDSGNEDVS